jgi:ATP-binding cassette subfamily B protein
MLFVDGVDINDWPVEDLRKHVGYVSQDVFLFSETVMENIAFGLHDWMERTENGEYQQWIEQCSRLASVHDEILGLDSGYQTRLGERGINLSGGQKQRLTIARALAKRPSILVLDDALASVDVQTEEKILQGLRSRPDRNTELIAAHRISTIREADRIVVLRNGRIVQSGTHQQLIASGIGDYFQFYEQQQLKEDLESYEYGLR